MWYDSYHMSHIVWVISYESYRMSHWVCKLNTKIFTCMFVALETIAKIRNRNLKGRVSSPSFMVSEKQSWLHPKFHNCGWIGSFLVNQGLVLSNESRDLLRWLVYWQGETDRRWGPVLNGSKHDKNIFRCCVPNCKKSEECGFHQSHPDTRPKSPDLSVNTGMSGRFRWKLWKSLLIWNVIFVRRPFVSGEFSNWFRPDISLVE